MSLSPKILVVEDEVAIQALLRYSLDQAGFRTELVDSAERAMASIAQELPAVVLLDLMLPGMNGQAMARKLRADPRTRDLPLIMVTALAEEDQRVQGLEIGADDYVTKPFSPKELIARIRAVLRRRAPHQAGETVELCGVRVDPSQWRVTVDGNDITLAPTEFELLQFLLTHPNRVFSRDQLLNALRGDHRFLEERTVDVYIRRLRAALGARGETLIETVRGVGYKLSSPGS
jgi:two-component system phosphate regulon response regulator PhoB